MKSPDRQRVVCYRNVVQSNFESLRHPDGTEPHEKLLKQGNMSPSCRTTSRTANQSSLFVLEKDSSVDPISLAKCTGDLLLNLGEVEG